MNADTRYLSQTTDMDDDTFLSCLSLLERIDLPEWLNDNLPECDRSQITLWRDDDLTVHACLIRDRMDEYGRYRRVRRVIYVPDDLPDFEVIVGNIGTVYRGDDIDKATEFFTDYVGISNGLFGRASGEDVTLFEDGDILMEHVGWLSMEMNDESL